MDESKRRREFYRQQPHERLGNAPVKRLYQGEMMAVMESLDVIFNGDAKGAERKTGFILLVFPFNDHEGRCNYMSNGADRRDVVTMMKEIIARFEGQAEVSGRA